jgi:hypothetical protein
MAEGETAAKTALAAIAQETRTVLNFMRLVLDELSADWA